jgi:alkylation response protein AidB-like acyl-CoA dehydrogenase
MTENVASRYFRELRVDRIWEGTSEIQRVIIARGLIKRGQAPYTAISLNGV